MRQCSWILALLCLAGCGVVREARMPVPAGLDGVAEESFGRPGWGRRGEFTLGGQPVRYERGANRLSWFDTLNQGSAPLRYTLGTPAGDVQADWTAEKELLIDAADAMPALSALFHPDRWLLWLGLLFVLCVYHFPTGIVGRLRLTSSLRGPKCAFRPEAISPPTTTPSAASKSPGTAPHPRLVAPLAPTPLRSSANSPRPSPRTSSAPPPRAGRIDAGARGGRESGVSWIGARGRLDEASGPLTEAK